MKTSFSTPALILAVFLATSVTQAEDSTATDLAVDHLRCEYRVDPLGIDAAQPRLSWIVQSAQRGQRQRVYQILVASSREKLAEDNGDLWDSGKVTSATNHLVSYRGEPLESSQRVFWKVRAWDRNRKPSSWSEPATWTMGIVKDSDWQARWIQDPCETSPARGLPIFRKRFTVAGPVRQAVIHICGLGQHEVFLNGQKVGDRFLDPAWSVYDKTVYYTTYDIGAMLKTGNNVFGVMLGKGFYNTAGDRRVHGVHVDRPLKVIAQAHIELADGSVQTIVTDTLWSVKDGPITHCAILGGSDYDARRLPAGWAAPGYDDANWSAAAMAEEPKGQLVADTAEPMKVAEVFERKRIDQPEDGVFVYDFGQNASAVPSLRVRGKAGQVVTLTPAEQRFGQSQRTNDGQGRVNQAGVGKPNYWAYTLNGDGVETWSPLFTYSGFQYLELTGGVPAGEPNPKGLPVVEALQSCHVRNDSPTVGSFECSNPLLNDIHGLIDWAVRSNMGHVLTDCPHREKLGWLEVSYLMEPSIACRYDIAGFYSKITRDIRDSQDPNGAIYTVAPNYPRFPGGFRYTPEWGAAGVILPWQIYRRYGDPEILTDNYDTMKRFVGHMLRTSKRLVPIAGLGDWYDYGHGKGNGPARFTSPELTAMATFYRCTAILAETAKLLGKEQDRVTYSGLAERIRKTFNDRYLGDGSEYENLGSPQTANAMALSMDLVPGTAAMDVLDRLVADIRARGNQQTAGDIGFAYLVEALARYGRHDVLFDIATRHDLGSYGYIRDRKWTSLPEAWDANTGASMNHCMLGHIQQWFYHDLAGIQNDPSGIAFSRIVIRPQIVGDLTWVKASHTTTRGTIRIHWKRDGRTFSLDIEIPVGTVATVYIPAVDPSSVTESRLPVAQASGVRPIRTEGETAVLVVESGHYTFASDLPATLIKK